MTNTYDIHDIAGQMDRLFANNPEIVDESDVDHGYGQESGHKGYEGGEGEPHSIGWYCGGGSSGHPVLSIDADDVQRAGEILAGMESARSLTDVVRALTAAGVRCEQQC